MRATWKGRPQAASYGLILLLSFSLHADYQDGLDAYSYGDYATAMKEWRAVTDGPATAVSPPIYIEAHYAVAMLYWQGQGVAVDFRQAYNWLLKAAEMGHAGAQAKLGFLYTDGKAVARDHQQAFEWFSQAAKGGNVDGLYNLGIFYLYGWGVEQDTTMAAQYLAAAAALGDEAAEQALPQVLEQIEEEKSRAGPAPTSSEAVGGRFAADTEDTSETVGGRLAADTESTSEGAEESRAWPAPTVSEDVGPNLVREAALTPEESRAGPAPTADESRAEPAPTSSEAVGGRFAADSREQGSLPQGTAEGREQGSLLRDENWIRAQDPQHYTIQVMALRSRDSVEEFTRDYGEFAPFAVFTVQKGTQPLHILLQGNYADIEAARAAKARFPRKIQQQDALWIRRFDVVQRLLEQ